MPVSNYWLAVLFSFSFFLGGCASDRENHPKQNEKPALDESQVDHDQAEDPEVLFRRLDDTMSRWSEARERGDHGWIHALERELRELAISNMTILTRWLQGEDGGRRVVAAMALGFSRDSRVLSPLMIAIHDDDSYVRSNALIGIGLVHDPDTPVDPILEALSDKDPAVRLAAAYCLGEIVPPKSDGGALVPLMKVLRTEVEDSVKNHAVVSLGHLGNHMAVPTIISSTLFSENPDLRLNSVVALGKIKDRRAVIPLVKLLDDQNRSVRQIAEEALAAITGEDFGSNRKAWDRWVEDNRNSLD